MKKPVAVCLVLILLFCLPGCFSRGRLTLARVRTLAAEKGAELSWSDFASYPSTETGSGLYIRVYEIDEDYSLMIGGVPDETPMYIYLIAGDDFDRRIDVRYDDIDTFLAQMNE